jgi:hypothetical protein
VFSPMRYRPGDVADRVTAPMLVCVAERDTAGSGALAVRAGERAPRGELRRYPLDHFAVHAGAAMEQVVADQTASPARGSSAWGWRRPRSRTPRAGWWGRGWASRPPARCCGGRAWSTEVPRDGLAAAAASPSQARTTWSTSDRAHSSGWCIHRPGYGSTTLCQRPERSRRGRAIDRTSGASVRPRGRRSGDTPTRRSGPGERDLAPADREAGRASRRWSPAPRRRAPAPSFGWRRRP